MFESYNYFRQHNNNEPIEDYKSFYRRFSNEREFGADFTNYDHLVKSRFMDIFGHMVNVVLRKAPDSILDIGCGNGINLPISRVFPWVRYCAIDYAERTVEKARAQYPNVNFEVGDAFSLPYEKESFDLVILSSVLMLYRSEADRLALMGQARSVLKKNGVLALIVWNEAPMLKWSIRLSRLLARIGGYKLPEDFLALHFREREVSDMAEKSSLAVEERIHTAHYYGLLESVRYLNMLKYRRSFGKAESEAGREHSQNRLADLEAQAGGSRALVRGLHAVSRVWPSAFCMFSIYLLRRAD